MKKTLTMLCAAALVSAVLAAPAGEKPLAKGDVLVSNGLSRGGAPKSSFQALRAAVKAGWGLCCDVTILKDGGLFLVDAGVVSRIGAYNGAVCDMSSETLKGLNLNENSGGSFDDLDLEFFGPCDFNKFAPLVSKAGTVMFRFTNGLSSTEATAAEIKRRFTAAFGGNIPPNVIFASSHLNMLIDLRREMPDARIWWYIWPCARKTGKLHPGTMPKALSAQIKKHKFNGIIVMFAPGETTVEYFKEFKTHGCPVGTVSSNSDISPAFVKNTGISVPIVSNPGAFARAFKRK